MFTVNRDGKSKKRAFGLFGSNISLVDVDGSKHCFRVLDGIESIVLQAQSHEDMMEWAVRIAHSISMENGGGLILDKEKTWYELQSQSMPIITSFDDQEAVDGAAKSIIFSKPINEPCLRPEHLEPITELNFATHGSLDPAEMSHSMEEFANHFFVANETTSVRLKNKVPVQSLRNKDMQQWLTIDRVSSASSGEEILERLSDCEGSHVSGLQEWNEITKIAGVVKID